MKKILWLGIIFSFLFVSHSFAAYIFTPTVSGTTITATLSGIPSTDTNSFKLLIQTTPFPTTAPAAPSSILPSTDTTTQKPNSLGIINWTEIENPGTTYYVRVEEIPNPSGILPVSTTAPTYATDPAVLTTGSIIPSTNTFSATTAPGATLNTSSYTLLSKGFPGLSVLPDPILCAQERADAIKNKTAPPQFCDINDVLNYFLKLMIGICGVVLVFRLMYEGFVIMTTDVPFIKASSKGAFMTALGGLLLALTSYIILNTINPKLVQENVGIVPLAIGITAPDTDPSPITQDIASPTSGAVGACTAGIVRVTVQSSSFVACSTYNGIPIATNLKNMLTAAYASGITLQGGGFRSSAQQTALRVQNCGGDTTNPNASCSPPTAPVGHSNHESGLAFDFTCNGTGTIKSQSNVCFQWLQANAGVYGFKNFAKEPWHWSWDGR